jgi:AraC-like DNA-binding protein
MYPSFNSDPFAAQRPGIFSEAPAWEAVKAGWRPLQGSFCDLGYSVEWHDFTTDQDLDWAPSFHPGGVEICLNLSGRGEVQAGSRLLELNSETAGFYFQNKPLLKGRRTGRARHRFLTVEFSVNFLVRHLAPKERGLDPALSAFVSGRTSCAVSGPIRLSHGHQQLVASLNHPPVGAPAQRMWSHGKALEIAATLLYQPEAEAELFCHRHKRQNRERVGRVIALLAENLAETPTLEQIGRRVGCSPFYLSRIFSGETGRSIFQYLRALRLERSAELLREQKLNVTQVALAVGYSSPSHFSTAFHEMFGCCPGLYPLRTQPLLPGRLGGELNLSQTGEGK